MSYEKYHYQCCENDDNDFSNNDIMKRQARVPTVGIEYTCEQCNLKFTDKNELMLHVQKHTEDKDNPYQCSVNLTYTCDQCNQFFSDKSELMLHVQNHTENNQNQCSGDITYTSDYCKNFF